MKIISFQAYLLDALLPCAAVFLFAGHVAAQLPTLRLEPVSENAFESPVGMAHAGDGSGRMFVLEQRGRVMVIEQGKLGEEPFLDISDKLVPERDGFDERGLLGIAFHPDFAQGGAAGNGRFYVYYSAPSPDAPGTGENPVDHQSVISEFALMADDPGKADPESERLLLTIPQPQFNHDGGQLAFGPDGFLYIATGDGGGSDDNNPGHTGGGADKPDGGLGNAQDLSKLLGKILRIEPIGANAGLQPYLVPADNPFVQAAGARPEIWAYGLRNPWRFSFDDGPGGTGRLWVADVGQRLVEEINIVQRGGNYGWRLKEGTKDFDPTVPAEGLTLIPPVAEYAHPGSGDETGLPEFGISITGGYVYRGSEIPGLEGTYIFGDWSRGFGNPSGTLLAMTEDQNGFKIEVLDVEGGNPLTAFIPALGVDESGEIYVATKRTLAPSAGDPDTGEPTGSIFRIVGTGQPAPEPVTIVLEPNLDNSIYSESPTSSNGKGRYLFAGETQPRQGGIRRALLQFDVAGVIPVGSTIEDAKLSLRMNKTAVGAKDVSVHRVLAPWGESTSNASGEEGEGAPASDGDATWNQRLSGTDDWSTPGGDFEPAASATTSVNAAGRYDWRSGTLTTDVQAFLEAPEANFGWILIAPEEGSASAKRFDSREATNAANRPMLEIAYIAPFQPPLDARAAWVAKFFQAGEQPDFQADIDHDGLNGTQEYAFDFDPNSPNGIEEAFFVSNTEVRFLRKPSASDLLYVLEVSRDLQNWESIAEATAEADAVAVSASIGLSEVSEESIPDTLLSRVTATIPPAQPATPELYVRLTIIAAIQ